VVAVNVDVLSVRDVVKMLISAATCCRRRLSAGRLSAVTLLLSVSWHPRKLTACHQPVCPLNHSSIVLGTISRQVRRFAALQSQQLQPASFLFSTETCTVHIDLLCTFVSEWHSDKVDWSGKNADFFTLTGCHGNVP